MKRLKKILQRLIWNWNDRMQINQCSCTESPSQQIPNVGFRCDHLHTLRIEHEPASTQCVCGCTLRRIGEDVSEKLNFRDRHSSIRNSMCVVNVFRTRDTLTQQASDASLCD